MGKHNDDLVVGLDKKTYDIEPEETPEKDLPKFDVDKPIVCPKCGAPDIEEEEGEYKHSWWIDMDGVWHFECFDCNHEWKARLRGKRNETNI